MSLLSKEGERGSRVLPPLNVDDDRLYQPHSDSEESEEKGPTEANINRFKHRLRGSGSASESGSVRSESPGEGREKEREGMGSSDEDIIIEHVSSSLQADTIYNIYIASIRAEQYLLKLYIMISMLSGAHNPDAMYHNRVDVLAT